MLTFLVVYEGFPRVKLCTQDAKHVITVAEGLWEKIHLCCFSAKVSHFTFIFCILKCLDLTECVFMGFHECVFNHTILPMYERVDINIVIAW